MGEKAVSYRRQYGITAYNARHCTPDTSFVAQHISTGALFVTRTPKITSKNFVPADKQQTKRQDNCTKFFIHNRTAVNA